MENIAGKTATPEQCPVGKTFSSGAGQRIRELIEFVDGSQSLVMVHTAPIRNSDGTLELVLEVEWISPRSGNGFRTNWTPPNSGISSFLTSPRVTLRFRIVISEFWQPTGGLSKTSERNWMPDVFEVYQNRYDPCCNCPVSKTFEDGQPHQAEITATSKSGENIHLLVVTAPLRNAYDQIVQVMELATNITQVRNLQDHLSSLGLLMSSISHAVKGMLTALDGGLYLIQSGLNKNCRTAPNSGRH